MVKRKKRKKECTNHVKYKFTNRYSYNKLIMCLFIKNTDKTVFNRSHQALREKIGKNFEEGSPKYEDTLEVGRWVKGEKRKRDVQFM